MGRLGPLTSQALGRSPYDDVVEGTGEPDPLEPEKQYDDKGRIINPETKKIIKDVIRSHNEVMHVIGVAEPDADAAAKTASDEQREDYQDYEAETGRALLITGQVLGIMGNWGLHGIRQRLLVYTTPATIPLLGLWGHVRRTHSITEICLAGTPAFFCTELIQWFSWSSRDVRRNRLFRGCLEYIHFHLELFFTFQRLDLIPARQLLPTPSFFVPFSESSPFSVPPIPETFTASGLSTWAGKCALRLAPFASWYIFRGVWRAIHSFTSSSVAARLPRPSRGDRYITRSLPPNARDVVPTVVPESPTLGAADREIRHSTTPDGDVPALTPLDEGAAGDAVPVEAIRRQSTFSSRGVDDYGTDEEDAEMVNPTLISFDVDTTDVTNEQPAGVWSAELRPSFGPGEARAVPEYLPIYETNPLTMLPSLMAGDTIARFVSHLACVPLDATNLRGMARVFAEKRGLPWQDMMTANFFSSVSMTPRGLGNILGLEIVKLLILCDTWAFITILSQFLHVSEEEWLEIQS